MVVVRDGRWGGGTDRPRRLGLSFFVVCGLPRASGGRAGLRRTLTEDSSTAADGSSGVVCRVRVCAAHDAVGCNNRAEGGRGGFRRCRATRSMRCRSAASASSNLACRRRRANAVVFLYDDGRDRGVVVGVRQALSSSRTGGNVPRRAANRSASTSSSSSSVRRRHGGIASRAVPGTSSCHDDASCGSSISATTGCTARQKSDTVRPNFACQCPTSIQKYRRGTMDLLRITGNDAAARRR